MGATGRAAAHPAASGVAVGGRRRRRGRRLAALGCVTALAAVGALLAGDPAAAEPRFDGEVFDFGIAVPDEPLTVGDAIGFVNAGERPHTVTDRGNTFDTDGIKPGETATVTFEVPGVYEIFCRINPGSMNATVVVEPGDEPPSEVRIQAFDPDFDPDPDETFRFDPPELQVRPGTRITVANVAGSPHTLTADDGSFDTGEIEPGAEQGRFPGDHASFVVEEQGVFDFHCTVHPEQMRGILIVAGDRDVDEPEEPPPDGEPEPPEEPVAAPPAALAIDIVGFTFDPFEIAVQPGAQLTWTNRDDAPHTATFDEVEGRVEGLDTGTVAAGGTGVLAAPDAPGSYSYFCAIHPSMRGVLVVTATSAQPDREVAGPEAEEVRADPGDDPDDVATQAVDGGFSAPALVGAIAILVAGGGAIVIALRGGRPEGGGGDGSG